MAKTKAERAEIKRRRESQHAFFQRIGSPHLLEASQQSGTYRKPWTDVEDEIVMSALPLDLIARKLGRSYHAVASRRTEVRRAASTSSTG